jgi:DNA-directed RNA polymerase sigma subunit (sigma70/sigma32)
LDLEPEQVQFYYDIELDVVSLDQPIGSEDGASLADFVPDGLDADPSDLVVDAFLEV